LQCTYAVVLSHVWALCEFCDRDIDSGVSIKKWSTEDMCKLIELSREHSLLWDHSRIGLCGCI